MTLDAAAQVWITLFGLAALFFVSRKSVIGPICGLVSQPAWFITSFVNQQWGVFLLSFAYFALWAWTLIRWRKP